MTSPWSVSTICPLLRRMLIYRPCRLASRSWILPTNDGSRRLSWKVKQKQLYYQFTCCLWVWMAFCVSVKENLVNCWTDMVSFWKRLPDNSSTLLEKSSLHVALTKSDRGQQNIEIIFDNMNLCRQYQHNKKWSKLLKNWHINSLMTIYHTSGSLKIV